MQNRQFLTCLSCKRSVLPGTTYCPFCGEAVDPTILAKLHSMFTTLTYLEQQIRDGKGTQTVADLHDSMMRDYLILHKSPLTAQQSVPQQVTIASGKPAATITASAAESLLPTSSVAPTAPSTSMPAISPAALPKLSWSEFLSEQAISIIAYLGGFILLIAILSFEISSWNGLSNVLKFAIVAAVYTTFGIAGTLFLRFQQLNTVGRIYLAIFALMTPLVGLALYLLLALSHSVSLPFVVFTIALYSFFIYIILARVARFIPYMYLGWVSLLVASYTVFQVVQLPQAWDTLGIAITACVALLPEFFLKQWIPLEYRKTGYFSAFVLTGMYGILLIPNMFSALVAIQSLDLPAFTAQITGLFLLSIVWNLYLRRQTKAPRLLLILADVAPPLSASLLLMTLEATFRISQVNAELLPGLLTVALTGYAHIMFRSGEYARNRRVILETSAIILSLYTFSFIQTTSSSLTPSSLNAQLVLTVSGMIATVIFASAESYPWVLLISSVFIFLTEITVFSIIGNLTLIDTYHVMVGTTGATFAIAFILTQVQVVQRYARPVYFTAVLIVLPAMTRLWIVSSTDFGVTMGILGILAIFTYHRKNDIFSPNAVAAMFNIASLLAFSQITEANILIYEIAVLTFWLAAIAVRSILVRAYSITPTISAIMLSVLFFTKAYRLSPDTERAAIFLFAAALLAGIFAFIDRSALATYASAGIALLGTFLLTDALTLVSISYALITVGLVLYRLKGSSWSRAYYIASILMSYGVALRIFTTLNNGGLLTALYLLTLAAIAYGIAKWEKNPVMTLMTTIYAAIALQFLPATYGYWPGLAMTIAAFAFAVILRQNWRWALAFDGVALFASFYALQIAWPAENTVAALCVLFAALGYARAIIGKEPLITIAAMPYAIIGTTTAMYVQTLLPFAILLTLLGGMIGRIKNWKWSLPFYILAGIVGIGASLRGTDNLLFEAITLGTLSLLLIWIAIIEKRAEPLIGSCMMALLALAPAIESYHLNNWEGMSLYLTLGWYFIGVLWLWQIMLPISAKGSVEFDNSLQFASRFGEQILRIASIITTGGVIGIIILTQDTLLTYDPITETLVVAWISLAGLIWLHKDTWSNIPILRYCAGLALACALAWQISWFGQHNAQVWAISIGSYLIGAGSFIQYDEKMTNPRRWSNGLSLIGALAVLGTALNQSFTETQIWTYTMMLALEAVIIALVGIGIRSRITLLIGIAFVGIAAIRGAFIAIENGAQIAIVLGIIALVLISTATALSLRSRRTGSMPPTLTP